MKKTAASAENVYVDPSGLLKLYLHEPESRAMTRWRARLHGAVAVTLFGRVELVNAIGLALARGFLGKTAHKAALAALDDDFVNGRCVVVDVSWRAAFRLADDISRKWTPRLICRSLDVLHVASALALNRKFFVTFDVRQRELARATGLKLVFPR
ncbi:MAG TPA: type II toxin-antitoxin system VapC family toxin [Rhizomicrobium sp.]|jgi:predicted nucleic acid-binding protein|nr:type II toxin-antitoxin system VapC family toxin [Rhizomicrobium sp.]